MSEKTEKATPYKLQKAKEKGQVSKSVELTTCLSLLVILGMIAALWPRTAQEIQDLMRHVLDHAANYPLNLDNVHYLLVLILTKLTNLWLPLALAGGLAIVLGTMAQTGLLWSSTPLTPDFKRLNPAAGFKKVFSLKLCFDALKNLLKLSFAVIALFFVLKHDLPEIVQLGLTSPTQYPNHLMHFLLKAIFHLLLVLCSIAILDKGYTLWKYQKDNRMSKQEVKDEHKQREGDPKIKGKIKQLQQQLRQKTASLSQVKTADVVITNPTHLAIALRYDKEVMPAPKVVCKAQGEMVHQVKAIAKKHNIPIIENKTFARALHQSIELNHWISYDLFPVAADVFRGIYKQRQEA
jgi:flagellar biosynthetic protein FlhB/flagellar biosynthetic protein FliR/FlhB